MHYFALSPFQDPTSNNATLITQANYNPSLAQFIATREAFEAQLRNIAGLEFMVAFEPQETGQWVIRKQNRRKRRETEDAISIMGTYFIINDTILTAPAVGDVIASRLVGHKKQSCQFVDRLHGNLAIYRLLFDRRSIDGLQTSRLHPSARIHISCTDAQSARDCIRTSALSNEPGGHADA